VRLAALARNPQAPQQRGRIMAEKRGGALSFVLKAQQEIAPDPHGGNRPAGQAALVHPRVKPTACR
jgi:hypothetical protein